MDKAIYASSFQYAFPAFGLPVYEADALRAARRKPYPP